jgi:outer membrane receptor protein involved in Fe transport
MRTWILVAAFATMLGLASAPLQAQTTSELSGRVTFEERGLPGVTVALSSPALQGERISGTNAQGDYIFKGLPAGTYVVTFKLAEYSTLQYELKIATSQPKSLDAVMYPEAMQEEIVIAGQYEAVSTGSQGSQTIEQEVLEKLAVGRDIWSAMGLSAGTTEMGAYYTISGAPLWANVGYIDGVVFTGNYFIEDAILETTTATNNISANYGRFAGGVVSMVTKSGGNEFSGSFRTTITSDSWNGSTPLTTEQEDASNFTYEATFGGYILRDALWFFVAGREKSLTRSEQLVTPGQPLAGIPFSRGDDETRLQAKITGSFGPRHRIMLSYTDIDYQITNFSYFPPASFEHVDDHWSQSNEGFSLTYTGVLTDNFFVEAVYSENEMVNRDLGGEDHRLGATPVQDFLNNVAFNAPVFCGNCGDEVFGTKNLWGKASLFFSGAGTHDLVLGFDAFEDIRIYNNYQSATGYIWAPFTPQNYDEPGNPYTHIDTFGGYIIWGDVLERTEGSSFKTNSVYLNDTWRLSDRWTVNLGLRYDKNDGTDAGGVKVTDDSLFSPRLWATYDVKGNGGILLFGGASRYIARTPTRIGNSGAAAGSPTWAGYFYGGPPIHAGTPDYPTNFDALTAMFDWFFNVYGGPSNTSLASWVAIPGLTPKLGEGLRSPYADELTIGASFRLGARGVLRLDYVNRRFGDFFAISTVPNRWVAEPEFGILLDQAIMVNENDILKREYNGLLGRFDYRIGTRWQLAASYTYSEIQGTSESTGSLGAGAVLSYQEYKDPEWNSPDGLLEIDQRHKLDAWVIWNAITSNHHNLSVSLLQRFRSGYPYSAVGYINTIPYVGAPADLGYVGGPGLLEYFFSDRGAYWTDNITSTDIALNYSFFVNVGGGQLEFFLQPEVTNVFNESGVTYVNTTVYTGADTWTGLETFNPWTTVPVEGVHWLKAPSFGQPMTEEDFQQPRTIRVSLGLRF